MSSYFYDPDLPLNQPALLRQGGSVDELMECDQRGWDWRGWVVVHPPANALSLGERMLKVIKDSD